MRGEEITVDEQAINLTDDRRSLAAELAASRREVAELTELLAEARAEIGQLELQIALFSSTDPLTGLVNRGGLIDALQAVLDRLDRTGEPAALVLIRLPGLSGLDVGEGQTEDLIRDLAGVLGGGLRRLDRVGRLDRSTFGMVLADANEAGTQVALARLRGALDGSGLARELGHIELVTATTVVARRPPLGASEVMEITEIDLAERPEGVRTL